MDIQSIPITALIPQKSPFIFIDKLTHFDMIETRTSYTVRGDELFFEEGVFSEFGMIENIAQTCAARMGYINNVLQNEQVKIGFIGAIKNCILHKLPQQGQTIETSIVVITEVMSMVLINASMNCNGEVIASCEMKIALID